MGAREAKRSCPAVSQISNLMMREGREIFWVRKAAGGESVSEASLGDGREQRGRGCTRDNAGRIGTHLQLWAPCSPENHCSQSVERVTTVVEKTVISTPTHTSDVKSRTPE